MRPRPEGRGERQWRSVNASRVVASMRPRPEGRGEPPAIRAEKVGHPNQLQCGHDPKAVENGLGLLDFGDGAQLQCGHDPKAVENRLDAFRVHDGGLASMRPRPEGRGELVLCRYLNAARNMLQCGHDPKAVENVNQPEAGRWSDTGFNAATTRRPWRT